MKFKMIKLNQIGKIITGVTPKTKERKYYSSNKYMFIGPGDIKNVKRVIDSEKRISEFARDDYENKFITKNSIMVDCIGSDMGNVAISTTTCLTNQQINSISEITSDYNVDYIYYVLSTMKNYFHQIGINGSTMPIINKSLFGSIEIPVPYIKNQNKIVKLLNSFDKKIELNNAINNNLHEIASQLYEETFITNRSEDWNEYKLIDIADICNGYSYKGTELVEDSTIGMATIKNFDRIGGFKEDGFKPLTPTKAKDTHYANKFDVLVACTDLTQNADIIGNAILLLSKGKFENVVISMDLVKIVPKSDYIDNFMVYAILNSKEFKNYALGYTSGTTVLHLNKNCFKEFSIKLPEQKVIEKFIETIKPMYLKISQIIEENNILEQLRNTLLPKLMNGEIDLENIEI